jgi:hypothetical protein
MTKPTWFTNLGRKNNEVMEINPPPHLFYTHNQGFNTLILFSNSSFLTEEEVIATRFHEVQITTIGCCNVERFAVIFIVR